MSPDLNGPLLPGAPHAALRAALRDLAERLDAAGQPGEARELLALMETWWTEQHGWTGELVRQLGLHHDINNALVGVRGNAQLLLMGPAGQTPASRERLEVVIRESDRIREAAHRLGALKSVLSAVVREGQSARESRAA